MEYICLGIPIGEDFNFSKLETLSINYDLKILSQTSEDIDEEVKKGLLSYANFFKLSIFKVIKFSKSKQNSTSNEIGQDLINNSLDKENSDISKFLILNKCLLPKKYYIIFAYFWDDEELCRYKKLKIGDLNNFFIENISWNLWLFNWKKNYFIPDLEMPLVLEIDNEE